MTGVLWDLEALLQLFPPFPPLWTYHHSPHHMASRSALSTESDIIQRSLTDFNLHDALNCCVSVNVSQTSLTISLTQLLIFLSLMHFQCSVLRLSDCKTVNYFKFCLVLGLGSFFQYSTHQHTSLHSCFRWVEAYIDATTINQCH